MIGHIKLNELSDEVVEFILNSNNTTPAIFGELDEEKARIIVVDNNIYEYELPSNLNYTLNDIVIVNINGITISDNNYNISNNKLYINSYSLERGDCIDITLLSILSLDIGNIPLKATDEMIENPINDTHYMTPLKTRELVNTLKEVIFNNNQW